MVKKYERLDFIDTFICLYCQIDHNCVVILISGDILLIL